MMAAIHEAMTIEEFNALVDLASAINPLVETVHAAATRNSFGEQCNVITRAPKYQAHEVRAEAVLCSVPGFAVAQLTGGKFATWQPGHVTVTESFDELLLSLNGLERQWLAQAMAQ